MSSLTFSSGTTLADAQQNIAASSKSWVELLNAQRQAHYDDAIRDYNANMETGQKHDPPLVPPEAPYAYVLNAPDALGLIWPVLSTTERLKPTPPLKVDTVDLGTLVPPKPVANHWSLNWASRSGKWVTAGLDDGMPGGFMTPPLVDALHPSDPPHVYERYTTAVGPGWYLQVD